MEECICNSRSYLTRRPNHMKGKRVNNIARAGLAFLSKPIETRTHPMKALRTAAIGLALVAATLQTAMAQTLTKPVKIGVIADMSSLYSAIGGKGSVVAAKM